MEKRNIKIDYSNDNNKNDDDKYTFILPSDKYKDITISSSKTKENNDQQKKNPSNDKV